MSNRIGPASTKPVVTTPRADSPTAAKPTETTGQAGWAAGATPRKPTSAPSPAPAAAALGTPMNPKDMDIVCPVLNALVGSGKLKMAADGTVKYSDLSAALKKELGATADLRAAALAAATVANPTTLHNLTNREFNALELRSGRLKHASDSAILTGGRFDEAKFQALVSHAENGRMTETAFANAIVANTKRDLHLGEKVAVDGAGISKVEFGLALSAFGTKGPDGKVGIAVEDLRMLYQDKQIPTHLVDKASTLELAKLTSSIGKKVDAQFAARALHGPATASGLSSAGVRAATGQGTEASALAAMSAGKAANCPHMNKGSVTPQAQPSVIAAHIQE